MTLTSRQSSEINNVLAIEHTHTKSNTHEQISH